MELVEFARILLAALKLQGCRQIDLREERGGREAFISTRELVARKLPQLAEPTGSTEYDLVLGIWLQLWSESDFDLQVEGPGILKVTLPIQQALARIPPGQAMVFSHAAIFFQNMVSQTRRAA